MTPILTPRQKRLTARMEKLRSVCEANGTSVDAVLAPGKLQRMVRTRHRVWLTLWGSSDWGLLELSRAVKRDHSTVTYGIRRAAAEIHGTAPDAPLTHIRELAGASAS